jgi:hypothetical protein
MTTGDRYRKMLDSPGTFKILTTEKAAEKVKEAIER